jgi:cellulose synthase/poly-beta-1,6-N-acetylglucosamine synthase-like glycosyltransferase
MPTLPFGLDQFCTPLAQFVVQFWYLIAYLGIPLPIGIIGAWRWGIWLLRRLIGMWYRPIEPNGFTSTTAVITPVYNEDPELFRAALRSWAVNGPNEIIAVIDHTDKRCMEQFREFEEECAGTTLVLKMLITHTPGKRPALVDGILAATSDIVFLVDSDTVWDVDVLPKALAPFIDREVGGVTMRQRVLNPHSTAQRIFDVYLDIRYIDEIRFLTAFGDAVTCLSGRTAVYRRFVALTALEDLIEEKFFGRPVISGDDKALTLAVQSRGWKVRYQENACVYTPGATVMKVFLKQRLRWARNSWRADLKALGSGWTWHHPVLAFHLIDRLFQPFTTLVAPLYLLFALFQGNWPAVLFLISWWFISRSIKIWPHLRHHWLNIRVLPWYIFFNYWSAVMKIYAFFTMNQQGWITRWSRGGKGSAWAKSLQSAPSYVATGVTVGLMALFVHSLHETPVRASGLEARTAQAKANSNSVALLSLEGLSRLASPPIGQCQAPWFVSLPDSLTAQPVLAQAAVVAPPAKAITTIDSLNELCVMAGEARGACTPYTIAPLETPTPWYSILDGHLPLLPQIENWWSFDYSRFVSVTGATNEPQLCLFRDAGADSEANICTGYAIALPAGLREWWDQSGADATRQHFTQRINDRKEENKTVGPTPDTRLCILAGEHEGMCSEYTLPQIR